MNIRRIVTIVSLVLLSACGGGGGGGDDTVAPNTVNYLTVVLEGSEAASVKGIQATITLPTGVAFNTDAANKSKLLITPAANVPAGYIDGIYTAATPSAPATASLVYLTTGSLTAGDLVSLKLDVSPGVAVPAASAFLLSNVKLVTGVTGSTVSGASLTLR